MSSRKKLTFVTAALIPPLWRIGDLYISVMHGIRPIPTYVRGSIHLLCSLRLGTIVLRHVPFAHNIIIPQHSKCSAIYFIKETYVFLHGQNTRYLYYNLP